jgi:Spy/CpxP family protein refolding chaperone
VERLTRQLGLSADQAAKALTIFTNSLTAIQPLQTSMRQARQAAAAAVKTNETATIEHQATSIGLVTGQIAAVELKAEAGFYQILTAEQKAKMDQGGGRMGMGPGMMPPRGR